MLAEGMEDLYIKTLWRHSNRRADYGGEFTHSTLVHL